MPAFVTNKINFFAKKEHNFVPFETKKISFATNEGIYKRELLKVYGTNKTFEPSKISRDSPFKVKSACVEKGFLVVENQCPTNAILPAGLELGSSCIDLSCMRVSNEEVSLESKIENSTIEESVDKYKGFLRSTW